MKIDQTDGPVPPSGRSAGGRPVSSPAKLPAVLLAAHARALVAIKQRGLMFPFADYDARGNVVTVRCKKCGIDIRKQLKQTDGSSQFVTFSHYAELTIVCSDGSNHVTNCCVQCASVLTQQDLDDFIQIDAAQMLLEAKMQNADVSANLLQQFVDRTSA